MKPSTPRRRPSPPKPLYGPSSPAIIILEAGPDEPHFALGPFPSGDAATAYGFANLEPKTWYWLPLQLPTSNTSLTFTPTPTESTP